jgi:hypothetical protein
MIRSLKVILTLKSRGEVTPGQVSRANKLSTGVLKTRRFGGEAFVDSGSAPCQAARIRE